MECDLILKPTGKFGSKGEKYEVYLGEELLAANISPEFAACRVLKSRGYTGFARFRREGKKHYESRMRIDWAATHCVAENSRSGPRFSKWEPNPMFANSDGIEAAE